MCLDCWRRAAATGVKRKHVESSDEEAEEDKELTVTDASADVELEDDVSDASQCVMWFYVLYHFLIGFQR